MGILEGEIELQRPSMETPWTSIAATFPCEPLPPNSQREPIRTERLVIRPLQENDLQALHELRSQPEAMTGTSLGRPDRDIEESRAALQGFLPPHDSDTFLFGVFLAATGELIGEGGVHNLASSPYSWPEIGYKFRKEFWGKGYATEFLQAFLAVWWALPRRRRATIEEISPEACMQNAVVGVEQIIANADAQNIASRMVLEKSGFVQFAEWTEPDTQEHRLGQPITLVGYRLSSPGGDVE
ncbi:acyl-CoA N-acyltransferase [Hypoxylon fragiforme]|uniref:acyl-CoA N-acyltransferase n=1 Tax=Hypoxylon fragiforme TaxID=63214 RepID=UPI0020C6D0CF|nr:acyl-CoA N-acyltransferase [Hypoxylon fragiforme]KAI2603479.1 acyl-CoA N-acyltransferase [Hypoxylon fragiforme]